MYIDQLHAGHGGRGKHRTRHRVGNVVVFQIEEDAIAKGRHLPNGFGTSVAEELAANLEHADDIGNLLSKRKSGLQGIKV
jgi:hypothetical protein